uniref:C2H2-type domain-containing protein n=1 Tax=Ditylenchus dipsaci TaxID=166011 RepID=A0A915DGA3_9BILA
MPTSSSSCSTYDGVSSDEDEPAAISSPSKSIKPKHSPSKSPKCISVATKRSVKSMESIHPIRTKSLPRENNSVTKRLSPYSKTSSPSLSTSQSQSRLQVKDKLLTKLAKSSSASSLQNLRLKQPNRRSPLANELAARKLRARPSINGNHVVAFNFCGKNESSSSNDDLSMLKKIKSEPKPSLRATPFQIEEPVVVGDYSNPFEGLPSPTFYQQKMCDAIDLNRYLWLADNLGFSKRSVYRPFLIRNLCYMKRAVNCNFNDDLCKGANGVVDSTNPTNPTDNFTAEYAQDIKPMVLVKSDLPKVVNRMPSSIKFNFIRNNLCFGDRSAIVQCFHASEINCALGALKRIPSSTFDMKVNEKLNHISIDLPEDFGAGFMNNLDCKSRVEYFIVRVVFRYEDAEVGGECTHSASSTTGSECPGSGYVWYQANSFFLQNEEEGLSVVHGETSIVLHSSENLKISGNMDGGLQRKNFDNPFMSIQVQNTQDEDDEEEDEDEEDTENSSPIKSTHSIPNVESQSRLSHQSFESTHASERFNSASPMTSIPFAPPSPTNSFNENLPEKIALQFLLNFDYQTATTSTNIMTRSSVPSRESSIHNTLSKDDERFGVQEEESVEQRSTHDRQMTNDSNNWLLKNLNIGSPMELTENLEDGTKQKYKIRVLNSKYMCFFCLTQMSFPSLQSMLFHLRLCHARFKFTHENVMVSRNLKLPGFSVTLNHDFDCSFEMNPSRHYVKLPSEKPTPKKRIVVAPIWIVTKNLASTIRSLMLAEGCTEFNSFLLDRDISFSDGIRHGTRYCFEPPTKINHPWLIQDNSRNLSEITDLHPLEQAMMKLWNDFLLEIRITHLGKKMGYKASRLLFHLTNLVGVNCIDEEESKQFDSLEMERINQGKDRLKNKTNGKQKIQAGSLQESGGPNIIECLDDLKNMYPFASSRRLEKSGSLLIPIVWTIFQ